MLAAERAPDVWELFDPRLAHSGGDLSGYLREMLARCAAWFSASGASIFLACGPGELELTAQVGMDGTIPADARIRTGEGVAGACVEAGWPMLVKDPRAEPALARRVARVRRELGSAMVVPLALKETGCVGVLNLSRRTGEPDFSERDLERAAAVGRQIALAVGNARLVAETRRAHDHLRGVLEALAPAVFVVVRGEVMHANAAARDLMAYAPAWLGPALAESDPLDQRVREGDRVWWIQRCATADGCVLTSQEVTEREREQREAARLRRLAEIGQMTAAVAHEIRNPLTGIRSAAQMVIQAPEQAASFAQMIEEEVLKLNRICEEFLGFARPTELRREPLALGELARRLASSCASEFEAEAVRLTVEIDPGAPTIEGDGPKLEQAIRNLLRNAREACRPGGAVRLIVGPGRLEVEDDGEGMSPDTVERLFTPFFTTKAKGTGLGLSNVRKIVEAHAGRLEVESTEGRGARVRVVFDQDGER